MMHGFEYYIKRVERSQSTQKNQTEGDEKNMTEGEEIYSGEVKTPNALDNLKAIESKGIDFTQFEGQKKLIDKAEIVEVPSQFHESGTAKVLKVQTEVVTTLNPEGDAKEIRASELFNLTVDKDGTIGWSDAPKAALNRFLKKMTVSHPNELIGRSVTLRVRGKETAQGRREFLGFITD